LLIDRKEKKLSKAEKRMAERSYKIERGARISYKRTSYANFYPQAATSQSALSNHISTEKFNGMPSSFGHISSMNLNLKRNSYASYYNKPEQSSSDDRSSSFMNATSSRLSQLYEGAQDIDGSPTPVHPVLPAVNPSSNRLHDESTKQLQCPIQQKLPPNHYKSSNLSDQMQSKSMSEQSNKQQAAVPFPFKELAKQGVNIKEIVIRNDMVIPTNSSVEGIGNTIPLKAGDKVMLIQTPKGIYLRMGEKIIKIKLPASLLSSLVSPSNDLEDIIPQMAIKGQSITMDHESNANPTNESRTENSNRKLPTSKSNELVNLLSSDDEKTKPALEQENTREIEKSN